MKQHNIKGIAVVLNIIMGAMQLNAQGCGPPSTEDLDLCLFCHLFASPNKNCSANEPDWLLSVKSRRFQFIFKENPCSPAAGNNNLRRLRLYFASSWIPSAWSWELVQLFGRCKSTSSLSIPRPGHWTPALHSELGSGSGYFNCTRR